MPASLRTTRVKPLRMVRAGKPIEISEQVSHLAEGICEAPKQWHAKIAPCPVVPAPSFPTPNRVGHQSQIVSLPNIGRKKHFAEQAPGLVLGHPIKISTALRRSSLVDNISMSELNLATPKMIYIVVPQLTDRKFAISTPVAKLVSRGEFVALAEALRRRENMWLAYGQELCEGRSSSKAVRELLKQKERARCGFDDADTKSALRIISILRDMYIKQMDDKSDRSAARRAANRVAKATDPMTSSTAIHREVAPPVKIDDDSPKRSLQRSAKMPNIGHRPFQDMGFER